jgi:hypothetical protein
MNHESNGELVEPEQEEELSHEDRFSQAVEDIESKDTPTDEPDQDNPETEEVDADLSEETQEVPQAVEGPSLAMKNVAKQQGVPLELIATARDDEQLEQWMGMVAQRQDEEPAEAKADYAPELPEDEFPEDDPVRREFLASEKRHSEVEAKHQGDLEKVLTYALDLGDQLKAITTTAVEVEQKSFHDHLDDFQSDVLGKGGSLSSASDQMRGLIFQTFMDLKQELPGSTDTALIDKAALTFGQSSKSKLRNNAVRKQAKQRLGGPESAKGSPEPQLSHREGFDQKMAEINARNK